MIEVEQEVQEVREELEKVAAESDTSSSSSRLLEKHREIERLSMELAKSKEQTLQQEGQVKEKG